MASHYTLGADEYVAEQPEEVTFAPPNTPVLLPTALIRLERPESPDSPECPDEPREGTRAPCNSPEPQAGVSGSESNSGGNERPPLRELFVRHDNAGEVYGSQLMSSDAGDESLQRYKESLGLSGGNDLSDPSDPRVCIIQSLSMLAPGREDVVIDLSQAGSEKTLKDHPFKIKEGAKFTMMATFRVQHEILSGLHYVQVVKRKGIKVSKDSEMIGSYAPNTDKQPMYQKRFQQEEAPSGMIARGHYNAVSSFVDDDHKEHLKFEWSFDIAKDW